MAHPGTVVVRTNQELAIFHLFLDSLWSTIVPGTHLIFVDDGSEYAVQKLVERSKPETLSRCTVSYERNETPRGCGACINQILDGLEGDKIFIVDSDLILLAGWQTRMSALLDSDDLIGATGACLLYPQTGGVQHAGIAFSEDIGRHLFLNSRSCWIGTEPIDVQVVVFALCCLSRKAVGQVGRLDENYFNSYEDFDYCLRLREAGMRIRVAPAARAYHWELSNGVHRHQNRKINLGRFWRLWGDRVESDLWRFVARNLSCALAAERPAKNLALIDLCAERAEAHRFRRTMEELATVSFADERDYSHRVGSRPEIWLPETLGVDSHRWPHRLLFLVDNFVRLVGNRYWMDLRFAVREDDLIADLYGNVVALRDLRKCLAGHQDPMRIPVSESGRARFEQLLRRLPGGCSTAAKSPLRHAPPTTPWFAVSGSGGHFEDERGRRWLDFDMALAALILGHDPPRVRRAATRQTRRGVTFSVPSLLEGALAERLVERFPAIEAVRFCKDGSDATTAAVRIARRITGRTTVVIGSYHGWLDWSAVGYYCAEGASTQMLGIPDAIKSQTFWLRHETYEELESLCPSLRDVAAVVVCPENWSIADLVRVRDRCRTDGAVLVFDEVKSGLRYGPNGTHGAMALTPDLVCLGKSVANGFPLAVLGGRETLMQEVDTVRFSTTGGSEAVSLAAAIAVDEEISRCPNWPPWQDQAGGLFQRMQGLVGERDGDGCLAVSGFGGNFRIHTPHMVARQDPFRAHFVRKLADHRIFSSGFVLPCSHHRRRDFGRLEEALRQAVTSWP